MKFEGRGGMSTDCSVGTETHKVPQTSVNHNEGKIQSPRTR